MKSEVKPIRIVDHNSTLKERRDATNEARYAAIARLKAEHPSRYRELYIEEARKRGIQPEPEGRDPRRRTVKYKDCSPACNAKDGHTLLLGCVVAE